MELTPYGLWVTSAIGEERLGDAAVLAQDLGFGALWLGGSPRLLSLQPMLERARQLTVAMGIVNVWQYDPATLAAEFTELNAEFPGRVLVGIGVGHREATPQYGRPLSKMRAFLAGIEAAPHPIPREQMVLAALAPKMLDLSAERTLGIHPYFTPPAHTRAARAQLGDRALIAVEQAVVISSDPERAATVARSYAARYLTLRNYTDNLQRHGFTDQDVANGGSARLIDAIIPQGDAHAAAAAVRAHLQAGANHVCVQTLESDGAIERDWQDLAAALGISAHR
ncbi:MAG: TIGR03620 family F420-dependent LLM class oxidoreductase [Solirubrobacteraceae bacterium]